MRRLLFLLLPAMLGSAVLATAQDRQDFGADVQNQNAVTLASPAPPAAQVPGGPNIPLYDNWQIAAGYQFNWDTLFAQPRFHTNGVNFDLSRFFNSWFAVEAQLGIGFGNTGLNTTPHNLDAKTIFFGGGPKLAYRSQSRWEPWGHALVGLDHLRATQGGLIPGGFVFGSNTTLGWMLGGGVDYHVGRVISLRGEGDFIGTEYFKTTHRNAQAVAAVVVSF